MIKHARHLRSHSRLLSSTQNLTSRCRPISSFGSASDIAQFLSKPTWSVDSLLPATSLSPPSITSLELHHLLRLSALPPPASVEEEKTMMSTLSSQLHFVREIQNVNTEGVEPMRSLRDETANADKDSTFGLENLASTLEQEEIIGNHHQRIRRKTVDQKTSNTAENWDVLGCAEKTVGRYFMVDSTGKE